MFTNLTKLEVFDVANNSFSGSIPSQISKSKMLVLLTLSGNYFTGSIPTEVGSLPNLLLLDFPRITFLE